VHSRVEYTLDQLDRLTLPPSETGPTVTVNTTTEQAHTGVDDQFAQPEETEALSPDEDDEQHGVAIVESGCHRRSTSVSADTPRMMRTTMRTRNETPGQSRATQASGSVRPIAVPTGPTDLETLAGSSRNRRTRPPKIYSD
jgi:hypothetical protein